MHCENQFNLNLIVDLSFDFCANFQAADGQTSQNSARIIGYLNLKTDNIDLPELAVRNWFFEANNSPTPDQFAFKISRQVRFS